MISFQFVYFVAAYLLIYYVQNNCQKGRLLLLKREIKELETARNALLHIMFQKTAKLCIYNVTGGPSKLQHQENSMGVTWGFPRKGA